MNSRGLLALALFALAAWTASAFLPALIWPRYSQLACAAVPQVFGALSSGLFKPGGFPLYLYSGFSAFTPMSLAIYQSRNKAMFL